jgi:hypothetical protein
MSNRPIYLWIGVPALTALIVTKIQVDYFLYKAFMARFDAFDAKFNNPSRIEAKLDIR